MDIRWIERSTEVSDVREELLSLVNESILEEGMIGYAKPLNKLESDDFIAGIARSVLSGNGRVLLIKDRQGPCGMAIFETSLSHNSRHVAILKRGFISPRARGGNLLAEALLAIVNKARALRVECLALDTREGSRAHQIWSHLGFQTWGIMPDYSRYGGVTYRGCFMSQTVDALEEQIVRRTRDESNASEKCISQHASKHSAPPNQQTSSAIRDSS